MSRGTSEERARGVYVFIGRDIANMGMLGCQKVGTSCYQYRVSFCEWYDDRPSHNNYMNYTENCKKNITFLVNELLDNRLDIWQLLPIIFSF